MNEQATDPDRCPFCDLDGVDLKQRLRDTEEELAAWRELRGLKREGLSDGAEHAIRAPLVSKCERLMNQNKIKYPKRFQ